MSKDDIKKIEERVEKLERKFQTVQSEDTHSDDDKTQKAHEAALASFNTEQKGGLTQSLNSATPKAEIEPLLEGKKKKNK